MPRAAPVTIAVGAADVTLVEKHRGGCARPFVRAKIVGFVVRATVRESDLREAMLRYLMITK